MLRVWLILFCATSTGLATPPVLDTSRPLTKIVFGSCHDQDKPCPAWDAILKERPELLILLGDTIYADLDKSKKITPELIREKYAQLNAMPNFAELRKTVPMLAVWDDHDFGKNDAGSEWALKEQSQEILLDFLGVPADSPRRSRKGVYHAEICGPPGQRVQIIMLDGRYHKTGTIQGKFDPKRRLTPYLPNTDESATFLGAEQWAWLEQQLKQPAEIRLLCSGIQVVSEDHPFEKWMNLPNERAKLYKLLRDTKANGVIILSGDRHLAELSMTTDAITYPLYDVTASGLNQATLSWRPPEPNRHRVAAVPFGNHFGIVQIEWTGANPRISLQIRGESGEVLVRHDIRGGLLTHQEPVANAEKPVELPEGVISAAEALGKVGEQVTVQFHVKATGQTKDGKRVFLNSEAEPRNEKNFTVMLTGAILTEGKWKEVKPETFKGKTIRASGRVTKYKEQVEIIVEDVKNLEVIE